MGGHDKHKVWVFVHISLAESKDYPYPDIQRTNTGKTVRKPYLQIQLVIVNVCMSELENLRTFISSQRPAESLYSVPGTSIRFLFHGAGSCPVLRVN